MHETPKRPTAEDSPQGRGDRDESTAGTTDEQDGPDTRRVRRVLRSEFFALLAEMGHRAAVPDARRPALATPATQDETMDVEELSAMLGLNRKTTYNQITLGQIPGVRRLGRRIVVHRATVLDWLRNGQGSVPRSRR